MTVLIDYDAGNIKSVEKALDYLGEETLVTRDKEKILSADRVILPGVGAFGDAMEKLESYGLIPVIREVVSRGTPFLGICLGLQLLFESSDEAPGVRGLGLLKGRILRIPEMPGLKIPHMGWNSLHLQNGGRLFRDIPENAYVYFVHSYYLKAARRSMLRSKRTIFLPVSSIRKRAAGGAFRSSEIFFRQKGGRSDVYQKDHSMPGCQQGKSRQGSKFCEPEGCRRSGGDRQSL